MKINRCISCENEIEAYPCPHCGFDAAAYRQPEYALPCNAVLHGRYLIGKVLGQGGFGITYMGWDLALETKVAVKEYYPNGQVTRSTTTVLNWYTSAQAVSMRESGMQTFLKEARKMAKAEKIPEVVRVRDTFAENETAYIVMDFVEGQTLKSRLEKGGTLTWEEAKKIFFPAISAMEQVHKVGIVHRDLSPDNLMLESDGSVKILDLGAAKDLSLGSGMSSALVAKAGFSPIEQYTERGGSGAWTDVYAMAATMYFALTGKLPAPATDRLNAIFNHEPDPVNWDFPQLRELPSNVLDALKNAMKTSAQDRTQSMAEFLNQLSKPKPVVVAPKPAPEVKPQPKSAAIHTAPPQISWNEFQHSDSYVPPDGTLRRCAVCHSPLDLKGRCPHCEPLKKKHSKLPWIIGAIAALVLLCLAFGIHPHKWEPATCTTPETCSICGKTRGESLPHTWVEATCTKGKHCSTCNLIAGMPLGHSWIAGTCTEARHCSVCGESDGTMGHVWTEATYTSPKTCTLCGATEGNVKGYYKKLKHKMDPNESTEQISRAVGDRADGFAEPVKNCMKMTLTIKGSPSGTWVLYGKDLSGNWKWLYQFQLTENETLVQELNFGKPTSFTHLYILAPNIEFSGCEYEFSDFYLRD